jgi:hypothetical protein
MVTHSAALEKAVPHGEREGVGLHIHRRAVRVDSSSSNDGKYTKDPNRNANPCPVWKSLLYRP